MTVLRFGGLLVSVGLLVAAVVLGTTPWRIHGGRFVTEYLVLAGGIGLAGAALLAITWRFT